MEVVKSRMLVVYLLEKLHLDHKLLSLYWNILKKWFIFHLVDNPFRRQVYAQLFAALQAELHSYRTVEEGQAVIVFCFVWYNFF